MSRKIFAEANAVTVSEMHEEDGQIINTEVMPAENVQAILDSCNELEQLRPKTKNMHWVARLPITMVTRWRKEWESKKGTSWTVFFAQKLNSSEYSRLRFAKRI